MRDFIIRSVQLNLATSLTRALSAVNVPKLAGSLQHRFLGKMPYEFISHRSWKNIKNFSRHIGAFTFFYFDLENIFTRDTSKRCAATGV